MRHSSTRFRVELLEDRRCPTVNAFFDGSNLTLSGTPNGGVLAVSEIAPNTVLYSDAAATAGPFLLTGNLTINLQGGNDVVALNLMGNTLPGNVRASLGAGGNTLVVTGNGGAGVIAGSLTYTGGTGRDIILLGASPTDSVTVGGLVNLNTAGGLDFLGVMPATHLQGDLFATGLEQMNLYGAVDGQVIVNDSTEGLGGSYGFAPGSTVGGQLVIQGGPGGNVASLSGAVAGDVTLVMGNGNNLFGSAGVVGGNLTYIGGFGSDALNVGPGTLVQGSLIVVLGNGTNTLGLAGGATVQGFVAVTGGTGQDVFGLAGAVGGNVSANLGDGSNTLAVTGSVGGTSLSYIGGSGGDAVVFQGTAFSARLTFLMGAGNDAIYLNTLSFGSGYFDGGTGTDGLAFAGPIAQPLTLLNFP